MAKFLLLVILVTFQIASLCELASSAKIVAYPMLGGSQYLIMRNIGLELAGRGHKFVIIASSAHAIQPSDKIEHRVYQVPYSKSDIRDIVLRAYDSSFMTVMKTYCECTLNMTSFHEEFKDFDLMVTDSSMPCGVILAEWFGIQWVEVCPAIGPQWPTLHHYNMPTPLSYIPQMKSGNTCKMTFLQRLKNIFVYILGRYVLVDFFFLKTFDDLKVKYGIKPERSIYKSLGDAEMVLMTSDFALEYAQPILPSTKMIGPMNVKKVKPLSSELEDFMASSGEHGVLMVSFGTNLPSIQKAKMEILAKAFGKLKQKVIWKMKGDIPSSLSPNIKIMEWLPQTDLLAHKKLKAFMTHVGHNSLYEAAYYGVPMIMMPIFADQPDNALKGEYHGLGLVVDHHSMTADQLQSTIETVISERRFKAAAEHVSRILRDRKRTSQEEAADWIEYVIRHKGARHLRPEVFNLTWYQYYLVDVAVFLAGILFVAIMVVRLVCRFLCRCFCGRSSKKKTD